MSLVSLGDGLHVSKTLILLHDLTRKDLVDSLLNQLIDEVLVATEALIIASEHAELLAEHVIYLVRRI